MEFLSAEAQKGEDLNKDKLYQVRGFLVYILIMNSGMTPYLKSVHQKLDQWRVGRDENEWSLLESELEASGKNPETQQDQVFNSSPLMVIYPVIRVFIDIHAINILTKSQTPPLRPLCPNDIAKDFYGFIDAAGSGYGI